MTGKRLFLIFKCLFQVNKKINNSIFEKPGKDEQAVYRRSNANAQQKTEKMLRLKCKINRSKIPISSLHR